MNIKIIFVILCIINVSLSTCLTGDINAIPADGVVSQVNHGQIADGQTEEVDCNTTNYESGGKVTILCTGSTTSVSTQNCVRLVCSASYVNDGNNNWIAHDEMKSGETDTINCPSTSSTGSLDVLCDGTTVERVSGGCAADKICQPGCIDVNGTLACWSGTIVNGDTGNALCDGNYVGTVTVTCNNAVITKTGTETCVPAINISGTITGLTGNVVVGLNLTGDVIGLTGLNVSSTQQTVSTSSFSFSSIASGFDYAVTVITNPPGEVCTVANGTGTAPSANVSNISITCVAENTTTTTTVHPEESSEAEDSGPAILACIVLMIITSICCCGAFWYFYTHKDLANAVTRRMNGRKKSKIENQSKHKPLDEEYDVGDNDDYNNTYKNDY